MPLQSGLGKRSVLTLETSTQEGEVASLVPGSGLWGIESLYLPVLEEEISFKSGKVAQLQV